MPSFTETFGETLVTKAGESKTSEVLDGKKFVGVYFSAHWVCIFLCKTLYYVVLRTAIILMR